MTAPRIATGLRRSRRKASASETPPLVLGARPASEVGLDDSRSMLVEASRAAHRDPAPSGRCSP